MADRSEYAAHHEVPALSETGSAQAPFIYFDDASAFGHLNSVIQVTLEAARLTSATPQHPVKIERVAVAHLRMSVPAARALKSALEGALLMAAPVPGQSN